MFGGVKKNLTSLEIFRPRASEEEVWLGVLLQ
jgi:hypothetical protein